jgi:hypothetical protein
VLDRNANGVIDGGAELFGTDTKLLNGSFAKHGFEALAEFDINKDGKINYKDAVYGNYSVAKNDALYLHAA